MKTLKKMKCKSTPFNDNGIFKKINADWYAYKS